MVSTLPCPRAAKAALAAGVAAASLVVSGCAGDRPAEAVASAPRVTPDLAQLCRPEAVQAVAAGLTDRVTVREVEEPDVKMSGGTRFVPANGDVPAFCQVTGSFVTNPATGKTANFLATFPANWNGKYLQIGCSGHCGTFAVSNPATPFVTVTNQGTPNQIIKKGYAAFATDEGHVGMDGGNWAIEPDGRVNQDAVTDYLYRAHRVLARMGKEFTTAFYRRLERPQNIARSYFSGCSGGGRDAFVAATYMPEAFDGIVGGSAYNPIGRAYHGVATTKAAFRSPAASISPQLLGLVDPIVKAQCDAVDGVRDGLIQNPAMCSFRPERDLPKCAGDKPGDACFTKAQVETLSTVITAVTDEQGHVVQPGHSVSELQQQFAPLKAPADPDAENPWGDTFGGDTGLFPLVHAVLKIFSHNNDPAFRALDIVTLRSGGPGAITAFRGVVPASEVAFTRNALQLGSGHFPEKADKLFRLDRKFLIWHNWSDEKLTPYMSINYYTQLARFHGGYDKVQQNVRLFMLPGTAHCSGGGTPVGPNSWDAIGAIEDWVEKGIAPDALPARLYASNQFGAIDFGKPLGRTMPLCAFPAMARYKGSGDVNDGANWSCPAGDRGLLQVGENGRRAGMVL